MEHAYIKGEVLEKKKIGHLQMYGFKPGEFCNCFLGYDTV
jgi:hypothetical protein